MIPDDIGKEMNEKSIAIQLMPYYLMAPRYYLNQC